MINKTMLTEFFLMNATNKDAKELNLLYQDFSQYFVWSSSYKIWTKRIRGKIIGRVVTSHPTGGERYYLRLLLMNVKALKSYDDLLRVMVYVVRHLEDLQKKRGLLQSDNDLIECMSEAACYQMAYSLRRLFAMILVYCNPDNPKKLWEQFKDSMSEDFKHLQNFTKKNIHFVVVKHINDILHSMGCDINEFNLVPKIISSSKVTNEAKEVYFERNINVSDEELLLHQKLNKEQNKAYDIILQRVFANKSRAFLIDGSGEIGKTFLYCALLATVRSKGFIALATTTSEVVASILPGERITHSHFKIPINIDEKFSCNIGKQSSLASLIHDEKLIVWDEVSIKKKYD
ncbi:uncharacterized protein LOC107842271 [Capsicum annuum]|uniref:uncharacterized protein LOC107842271 n=1 Tax=Capsicum annuum TaxID=4072 RepID=UPI0007BF440D|nr:uncharacterized protein LOC107842271 [Capsicum annuum]XP_047263847.1 uncharacterized protein LOC107842271 [Capsicum annuum]XP_047263848.1 uncharacterized protein LOC107842271 [Capsicum annuum]XP_047263849.1 uncharacterized protein LOC107842271 [Capsicum annuum]XP_047263850.1 uncharacterized protein LOC107842271 [Capsicum annuum]XP_047263851.1 uncharacterized protein LOC107842271 [Capsicum annuum]XP_047263852.1 uncharacterized protein LOC107842271 [Capsicum annuum]XP_047263853.1 uncharacte